MIKSTQPSAFNAFTGYSLIEIIIVMAIASIMMNLAVPSVTKIYHRSQATAMINWLVGTIHFTRHAAVNYGTTATLCPSVNVSIGCGGEWHNGVIVFLDHNRDAKINGRDKILSSFTPSVKNGTLKWRSFKNKKYLQLTEFGYTNYQNGNFVYCTDSRDAKLARQLVINVQGRVRLVHKRNEEGVNVDRRNKPLKC
jgi:type IV fimbrial biogenesis protein FimT|tara:strand:- start:1845 stop:2432 length:588 start_codon:yes stop_codon:yes gene_type:complete